MNIENNEEILTRYLSGECSEDEKNSLEKLLEKSPELQNRFNELMKIWDNSSSEHLTQDTEAAWQSFAARAGIDDKEISSSQNTFSVSRYLRYAAVILIFLLPLYYLSGLFTGTEISMKTLNVEFGDRQTVTLVDGSKITLDAGSTLQYPTEFGSVREVILNGEAFFEVAKNPDKPFIVKANQGEVKVLGTKFNIRSWKDFKNVQLTVTEGKVSFVNINKKDELVYLTKGQYSVISDQSVPSLPVEVSVERATGWLRNEKYFENVSLGEVITQLERWYNIDIQLSDKSALNELVTINIKNKGYKENLELLSLVTGMKVTYYGNLIMLN